MPKSGLTSPPGIKTRSRRSSVYQQKTANALSPTKTRSRRSSMYVSVKSKANGSDVFSKVWATPVIKPEPIPEISPIKNASKKAVSPKKTEPTTPNKTKAEKSLSPQKSGKKATKTPRKTPKSVSRGPVSVEKRIKKNETASPVETTTPRHPKSSKKATQRKTPASVQKKAVENTPRKTSLASKSPQKSSVVTSTPAKSLEQITGKSFYGTPGETPIQNKRADEIFVFSAVPSKSVKSSARKSVAATPRTGKSVKSAKKTIITPSSGKTLKSTKKTPNASARKSQKRRRDSDEIISSAQTGKRRKSRKSGSPEKRVIKLAKRKAEKELANDATSDVKEIVKPQSPFQIPSVLESSQTEKVKKTGKRKASTSPSLQKLKQPRLAADALDEPTPRIIKQAKRTSPKKLADIVESNKNNSMDLQGSAGNVSILNETFSTDSRSSRCVIL